MKRLTDIIEKMAETQKAMRKLESLLSSQPSRHSLQAAYDSLHKRHENLESKFLVMTDIEHLDVCTYRVFTEDNGNYPILAFGNALRDFQRWFSTIYDALKTGPKKRAKLSADIIAESSLNFAFSYPGSIGVAMTIPSERLIFENELQKAMMKSTEMLQAKESGQIQNYAQKLGVASIRAMYSWIEAHVNSGFGANIHWIRKEQTISEITAGYQHLMNLKQVIEKTSESEETSFEAKGWLVGADTLNHTFHMVFEEADEIRGKMSKEIGESYTVELPKLYTATFTKSSFVNYATEEEKLSYFLKSLKKP